MTENEFGFEDVFGVAGDETIQETGNYKTYEDGDYRVKGIHTYIKKDDRENPIFVPQGDNMVARFKLILLETRSTENQTVEVEVEGPPMSATYAQMMLLVRAFGGDIVGLPSEATTKFLLDAKDAANRGGRVRKANVKGGWVKFIEGMNPPAEAFTWEFQGFRSHDGSKPVRFIKKTQNGPNGAYDEDFAYADFMVVGDRFELESPYNGYRLSVKIKNPFDGRVIESRSGMKVPATKIGQKGGIPVDVIRFKEFCATFCPLEFFKHEWVADVERSNFGVNELENPLAVVDAYARRANKRAIAKLGFNKYNFPTLDVDGFIPARSVGTGLASTVPAAPKQPTELEAFYDYVTKEYGKDIFSPTDKSADEINLDLTPKGISWAKETLVPIWDALALPVENGKRYIGKLDADQLKLLTIELRKLKGESTNEAFANDAGAF